MRDLIRSTYRSVGGVSYISVPTAVAVFWCAASRRGGRDCSRQANTARVFPVLPVVSSGAKTNMVDPHFTLQIGKAKVCACTHVKKAVHIIYI